MTLFLYSYDPGTGAMRSISEHQTWSACNAGRKAIHDQAAKDRSGVLPVVFDEAGFRKAGWHRGAK
jgi:hypothetical protein